MSRPLLLSLKPYYADLIFEGRKKAELRRRIIPHIKNRHVFIYVSTPVKELRGGFRVGRLWYGPPDEVWSMVSKLVLVERENFDAYFEGNDMAYALEIKNVWEYQTSRSLNMLRKRFSNFVVPQSWRYLRDEERRSFQRMKREAKNSCEQ